MKKLLIAAILILALIPVATRAQDFVYQPINPAFGGNPYNYSWLLGQAQAQNLFEEEGGYSYEEKDPLAGLQDDINRQVLNSLTQQFYQNQFGEAGRRSATPFACSSNRGFCLSLWEAAPTSLARLARPSLTLWNAYSLSTTVTSTI